MRPLSRDSPRWSCGSCTFASRGTTSWPPAGPCRTHGSPLRSPGREGRTRAPTPARLPRQACRAHDCCCARRPLRSGRQLHTQ
eukprot:scaffold138161_cov130-Phaeocystis_antarctica.AAC.1